MLSSGPVCDEALLGPGEAIAVVREDATLVVTSSIPVETAAARGVAYLNAPVSGGEEAGTGELAKLVNRLIVASTIAVVAEAVLLAERGGPDPARVREVLLGGFARSTILEQHAPRMMARGFRPGGPAKHQVEDTSTVLAFARGPGRPVATLVDRLFADLGGHGDGDLDRSAVIRELRRHNDLPLT
jgi:3-hydroxyisobutyrate dehydrogenase-like beta-hydroxyacid dehydrogenase